MKVQFIKSSTGHDDKPQTWYSEYMFIWRSNVWKSSLINMLTNSSVAKTSSKPGKTIYINHYEIDNSRYIVDLPWYWYAKKSKLERTIWLKTFWQYVDKSKTIEYICVLLDFSLPIQEIDIEFMEYLVDHKIPFIIIFTKVDKTKKSMREKQYKSHIHSLNNLWQELPPIFLTSSNDRNWSKELLEFIKNDLEKQVLQWK